MDSQKYKCLFPPDTKIINFSGSQDIYEATLRSKCINKEEFHSAWLNQFKNLSKMTWRLQQTKSRTGKTVVYKAVYRCQHNTYPESHQRVKSPHKKHTGCPAILRVTIKSSVENRRVRSIDTLRKDYPTIITILNHHNHGIDIADTLKYRDISGEVKTKFINLFKSLHSPVRALEIHKQDLFEEYEGNYDKIVADSSMCPLIQSVYRLYYSTFKKEFEDQKPSLQEFLDDIKQRVQPSTKIAYSLISSKDFVLAAIPALMDRVHKLKLSGKTVFIDNNNNMNRCNCKVFLLLCDSSVGGLPLGFILTTSETEEAISCGLKLLTQILPSSSFGDTASKEPEMFLTDDCQALISSLRKVFPHSGILLCPFHILQSVWKWLLHSSHKICSNNGQYMFKLFKKTVFSENQIEFQRNSNDLLKDAVAKSYPNFIVYVNDLFAKSEMWPHSCRNIDNNNEFVESGIKVMKDSILNHTRAYNPVQIFQFIEIDFCSHYSQKSRDIINGYQHLRYFPKQKSLQDLEVKKNKENGLFIVSNKTTKGEHIVDLELSLCSCPVGKRRAPCKHQHLASLTIKKLCYNVVLFNSEVKEFYQWIADGTTVPSD